MNRRRDLGLCSTPGMISAYLLEESVHVRLSAKTFVERASLGELEIITGTGAKARSMFSVFERMLLDATGGAYIRFCSVIDAGLRRPSRTGRYDRGTRVTAAEFDLQSANTPNIFLCLVYLI
jgi:hypothetical protein